jgi:hypothetical protein
MGKNEKTPIDIDGKPYYYEDMTEKQQLLVNHVADLDRKLGAARFNVDQLQVGKDAFIALLKQELEKPEDGIEDGQLVEPTVQ